MRISSGQKKILIVVVIVAAFFAIFWVCIYRPAERQVRELKNELARVETRIRDIEELVGRGRSVMDGYVLLQEQVERLREEFPSSEEETIQMLSNTASGFGLDVLSIIPASKKLFLGNDGKEIVIEGGVCTRVPLTMRMRGRFQQIGEFLEVLHESAPRILTVEEVVLTKGQTDARLDVTIRLTIYLLAREVRRNF